MLRKKKSVDAKVLYIKWYRLMHSQPSAPMDSQPQIETSQVFIEKKNQVQINLHS